MWSLHILSFVAGLIFLFVAMSGGGFKIKEIEMPKVAPMFRGFSAIMGIVLVFLGVKLSIPHTAEENPPKEEKHTTQVAQKEEKIYCPDCKAWNFLWISQGIQYEALLIFNPGKGYGKMRVKFLDEGAPHVIQEEMRQVSTDEGQYLAGSNPFDANTFLPLASYIPDNVVMTNEQITVFDVSGSYEATPIAIHDYAAAVSMFGFKNTDLDF